MYYFDNASTSFPKPNEVYDFMDQYYRSNGINIGRGSHFDSMSGMKLLEDTRLKLLTLLNAPENKTVAFTSSATIALNMVLQGIEWKDGMRIYITPFEHNAVLRTIHHIKKKYKIEIDQLEVNQFFQYELQKIQDDFQIKKPDVIIMTHASNVIGRITPIKEIAELGKEYDAITVIDMAQTAGLIETDISHNLFDYVIFAGHKTLYGPFGIGGLVLSKNSSLNPLIFGGTGFDSADSELPRNIPEKFEAGSLNIQAIAGLHASLSWIQKKTVVHIREKEIENMKKLKEILEKYESIKIFRGNDEEQYIGLLSCNFADVHCDYFGMLLNQHNIAVRTGLHCSPEAHKVIGTFPEGTVRLSLSYFTSDDDFKALNMALAEIKEDC